MKDKYKQKKLYFAIKKYIFYLSRNKSCEKKNLYFIYVCVWTDIYWYRKLFYSVTTQ